MTEPSIVNTLPASDPRRAKIESVVREATARMVLAYPLVVTIGDAGDLASLQPDFAAIRLSIAHCNRASSAVVTGWDNALEIEQALVRLLLRRPGVDT